MTTLYKVSGAGNDFLVLLEPERDPTRNEVVAWCARGFAFGADGVFVLRRVGSERIAMTHWNADGGTVEQCLNGTRCAARLAFELGWAKDRIEIATGAGAVVGRPSARPASARIEVAPPQEPVVAAAPVVDGVTHRGYRTRVGVPHFVIVTSEPLADVPVATLGAALRRHADFGPAGTNVDWVRFPSPERMEIRSFERGVEGETLACGTGILAALAVGIAHGHAGTDVSVLTRGGFELAATARLGEGLIAGFTLDGDARLVARIELAADAAAPLPAAPPWR